MGEQQRPGARLAGQRAAERGGEVRLFFRPVRLRKPRVCQQQVAAVREQFQSGNAVRVSGKHEFRAVARNGHAGALYGMRGGDKTQAHLAHGDVLVVEQVVIRAFQQRAHALRPAGKEHRQRALPSGKLQGILHGQKIRNVIEVQVREHHGGQRFRTRDLHQARQTARARVDEQFRLPAVALQKVAGAGAVRGGEGAVVSQDRQIHVHPSLWQNYITFTATRQASIHALRSAVFAAGAPRERVFTNS